MSRKKKQSYHQAPYNHKNLGRFYKIYKECSIIIGKLCDKYFIDLIA